MKGLHRLCNKCPIRNSDCYMDLLFGIKHCEEIIEAEKKRKLEDLISAIIGFIVTTIPIGIVYILVKAALKILAGC